MTVSPDRPAPRTSDAELDAAAPRCPHCEYLLLGLAEPRCPECGRETTWEAARNAGARPVRIAFERAHGLAKVPAAFVTWLTVVFLPWVFAGHAALVQISVQAFFLAALDGKHRDRFWASVGFWLGAGGYTSAIMVTEIFNGPPLFIFHDFLDQLDRLVGGAASRTFPTWPDSLWPYLQVVSWLAALATLLVARTRRFDVIGVLLGLMTAALLFLMYMLCVEYVGMGVFNFLDHRADRILGPLSAN